MTTSDGANTDTTTNPNTNAANAAPAAHIAASASAATTAGLRLRLFAALRERAGWGERELPLPAGLAPITPLAIWERLELGPWPAGVRVAVNQQFADALQPLAAGDELAFLPPISGG
jgi:molybdopterin synthase sulfur carrier subunit